MRNIPHPRKSRRYARCDAKTMILNVKTCWSRWNFNFCRCWRHQHEILNIVTEIRWNFNLPLHQDLTRVKRQIHNHILTQNRYSIWFLIQSKSGFNSEKMLQGQRRFCWAVLESLLWIFVELQMKTIWKKREEERGEKRIKFPQVSDFRLHRKGNNQWIFVVLIIKGDLLFHRAELAVGSIRDTHVVHRHYLLLNWYNISWIFDWWK